MAWGGDPAAGLLAWCWRPGFILKQRGRLPRHALTGLHATSGCTRYGEPPFPPPSPHLRQSLLTTLPGGSGGGGGGVRLGGCSHSAARHTAPMWVHRGMEVQIDDRPAHTQVAKIIHVEESLASVELPVHAVLGSVSCGSPPRVQHVGTPHTYCKFGVLCVWCCAVWEAGERAEATHHVAR